METVRRGYMPTDEKEFGKWPQQIMDSAGQEVAYLLNRGYDLKAATTFVGNHYLLTERQRLALARILSANEALERRKVKEIPWDSPPEKLWIDGFNLLITLEVALSQSLLLEGMDGTIRDLAGLRGTYRVVDKTEQAIRLLMEHLQKLRIRETVIYLDQPVSNSGRLRGLILEMAGQYHANMFVELHPDVDRLLYGCSPVVTSDAIILDHCKSWFNLGRKIIQESIPDVWIYRLNLVQLRDY